MGAVHGEEARPASPHGAFRPRCADGAAVCEARVRLVFLAGLYIVMSTYSFRSSVAVRPLRLVSYFYTLDSLSVSLSPLDSSFKQFPVVCLRRSSCADAVDHPILLFSLYSSHPLNPAPTKVIRMVSQSPHMLNVIRISLAD